MLCVATFRWLCHFAESGYSVFQVLSTHILRQPYKILTDSLISWYPNRARHSGFDIVSLCPDPSALCTLQSYPNLNRGKSSPWLKLMVDSREVMHSKKSISMKDAIRGLQSLVKVGWQDDSQTNRHRKSQQRSMGLEDFGWSRCWGVELRYLRSRTPLNLIQNYMMVYQEWMLILVRRMTSRVLCKHLCPDSWSCSRS